MILNLNDFKEKHIYTLYEVYKGLERQLEEKAELNTEEEIQLADYKTNLDAIEAYSAAKRTEGIRWSLTSLWRDSGMNPTLILEFYPGTKSYNTYGKNLVVNVEYTDEDLVQIFENIRNGGLRVTRQLKFKQVPEYTDGELNTGDIFAIQ